MLEIINDLRHFFEDCYRRIHIREYARLHGISPPTASKLLKSYHSADILKKEILHRHEQYTLNKENLIALMLCRIYWFGRLKEMVKFVSYKITNPTIVLFGSMAKAEVTPSSDIDIAIFSQKIPLDLKAFEQKLGRKIEILWSQSLNAIKNPDLANNIMNGHVIRGRMRL